MDERGSELREYVRRTVDRAPPLTGDQRARLARLLRDVPASVKPVDADRQRPLRSPVFEGRSDGG